MDFHMSSIFERMVLKGKFFETINKEKVRSKIRFEHLLCRDFLVSCASLNLEDFVKVSGCHFFIY